MRDAELNHDIGNEHTSVIAVGCGYLHLPEISPGGHGNATVR